MVRKTNSGHFSTMRDNMPVRVTQTNDSNVSQYTSPTHRVDQTKATKSIDPADYTQPYLDFMTNNPTVFHAVDAVLKELDAAGYEYLSERTHWSVKPGGKYYAQRNGSSLIAFSIGKNYKAGNGFGIVAGHIDAITVKLKPVSKLPTKVGYVQLAVAPYASGLSTTWWDRDLGIGGRVLVKSGGKIETRLVKLDWPIAKVPTLAEHFGEPAMGPFNKETQMVPIIGLDNEDVTGIPSPKIDIKPGTFAATQPPRLVKAISNKLGIDYSDIVNWELQLYDITPALLCGLDKEFISAGRIDDKINCFSAIEGLLASDDDSSTGIVKMVGCFDDEEVGSLLRQGADSNFMDSTISRIIESTSESIGPNLKGQALANSFLVSSDVDHAVNPNFLNVYLENHMPRLNVGVTVSADSNANMTTDAVSTALLSRVAEKCGSVLQVFHIRNDSRSGGTIGPMTSSILGCRSIDCGIAVSSCSFIFETC